MEATRRCGAIKTDFPVGHENEQCRLNFRPFAFQASAEKLRDVVGLSSILSTAGAVIILSVASVAIQMPKPQALYATPKRAGVSREAAGRGGAALAVAARGTCERLLRYLHLR